MSTPDSRSTPGRAAYEAFYGTLGALGSYEPYDSEVVDSVRPGWEAAARAAIAAAAPAPAGEGGGVLLSDYLRERGNTYAAGLIEAAEREAGSSPLIAEILGSFEYEHTGWYTAKIRANRFARWRDRSAREPQAAPELAATCRCCSAIITAPPEYCWSCGYYLGNDTKERDQ